MRSIGSRASFLAQQRRRADGGVCRHQPDTNGRRRRQAGIDAHLQVLRFAVDIGTAANLHASGRAVDRKAIVRATPSAMATSAFTFVERKPLAEQVIKVKG